MKLWEIESITLTYVWAEDEREARRKYEQQPCTDSADVIQSIKTVEPHETHFEIEAEDPTLGGTEQ